MTTTGTFPPQQPVAAFARELYQLLADLHDTRKQRAAAQQLAAGPGATSEPEPVADRARRIADRARALASDLAGSQPRLAEHVAHVGDRLEAFRVAMAQGRARRKAALWSLAKQYEGLARQLRAEHAADLPELKPRNYARNAYHVSSGIGSGLLATLIANRSTLLTIAIAYTAWMVSLEVARRMSPRLNRFLVNVVFGAIARPVEAHRINSATWYGMSIITILLLYPRLACVVAVLVLGLGDPAAANIGRRWGRHKVRGQKTLEGVLGFIGVATVGTTAFLWILSQFGGIAFPAVTLGQAVLISLVGAIAGAITELLSDRIEDNYSIPVVVGGVVSLLLLAM